MRHLPGAPSSMFSVMTWNVRYFGHALRGLLATEHGLRRAAHALATLVPMPDVVALQEVEEQSLRAGLAPVPQLERFLQHLHLHLQSAGRSERYTGLYYPAHAYRVGAGTPLYTTGLAILVGPRLKVEAHNADAPHEVTCVRVESFRRLKQRRVVAHARVRSVDGGPAIDVFNTHLSLPAFGEVGVAGIHTGMGHGTNQLREIAAVLDYVRSRAGEAAILMGDFNTAPGTPAYHHVVQAGLHDAFARANALDEADLHSHATAGFGTARMHIDHVFSTPNLRWETVEGFHFGEPHGFHGVSDHTPKVGRFRVD